VRHVVAGATDPVVRQPGRASGPAAGQHALEASDIGGVQGERLVGDRTQEAVVHEPTHVRHLDTELGGRVRHRHRAGGRWRWERRGRCGHGDVLLHGRRWRARGRQLYREERVGHHQVSADS
jgi:hypothetical protein